MNPVEFLRTLWPATGTYCLAIPRGNGAYKHWTFDTIEDAAEQAAKASGQFDVYFNMHTLRAKQVDHLTDREADGSPKQQVRVARNMVEAKCFFWDIDVDASKPTRYDTRHEALAALREFLAVTKLPAPMLVSSGGGFHVYWPLIESIATAEWKDHASHLRQLAMHYGLKIDTTRTTDASSVLRVAGTFNRKDPLNPRPVQVLAAVKPIATPVFVKKLNEAVIAAGVQPVDAAKIYTAETGGNLSGNLSVEYDGPVPKMSSVLIACPQMRRIAELKGNFSEPEWYRIAIGVGRFTENGHRNVHKLSSGYAGYSQEATNAKIKQSERVQPGPSTCGTVANASDVYDTLCQTCPFQGKVTSPIQAALWKEPAPAPILSQLVGTTVIQTQLPDPPKPFTRLKGGAGIAIAAKNADGVEEFTKIYDYDLYPIRRLANAQVGFEQQVWHVSLPRGEAKDFTLDADMLYDLRKFVVAIAHQGIYPHKGHLSYLQEYMTAYIAELQKLTDADTQSNHLGWTDDQTAFIMPDKVVQPDGSVKPSQLSIGAQRSSVGIAKKGTIEKQIKLMSFYNDDAYRSHQCMVLGSLGATIFNMTGQHGVIINASGDAGASKSTALYTAAGLFGQPELMPINGTNNGATVKGRNERVQVLANYPICVDEITHMPVHDMVDLAMSISQPGHRIRLQTDGVERATTGSYKATIMLSTANSSLHNKLSMDNAAGTAGSMRVFEIAFVKNKVHSKADADDYLYDLKENYGHIGEAFVIEVVKNREQVQARMRAVMREIDTACNIQPSERFWSACIAAILVAGEIAFAMGMLPYNMAKLRQWIIDVQVPHMRGVVAQEYSDPLEIVATYLNMINGNIVRTQKHNGNLLNVEGPRNGALLGHFDKDDMVLYVLKKGFRDHCAKTGANATKVVDDLHASGKGGVPVIPQVHTRRVLGAGTEWAKAQAWCFSINMDHPSVSGLVDLTVMTNPAPTSSGPGKAPLKAVK